MKEQKILLRFDGACDARANPPFMGIGVAVWVNGVRDLNLDVAKVVGIGTNNIAEYEALIAALEVAKEYWKNNKSVRIEIEGDSQLIVNQFNGKWEVKKPHLKPLYDKARSIRGTINTRNLKVRWVRREFNTDADILSKKAFGYEK